MSRILIVEDDVRLAQLTCEYLQAQGFVVLLESDGHLAVQRILSEQPDLVVLDLMLPGLDGFSICRRVRPEYKGAILMLTARTDDADQLQGFENGADDYVCKPARPAVLLARIKALLRRTDNLETGSVVPDLLKFGQLTIDHARRSAFLADKYIDLTGAEFDLLWLLAINAGTPLSREAIFSALRGIEYDGVDRSIDVRISRIRPRIGDDGEQPQVIKTIRNKGYLFVREAAQELL
ncbi:MAG: response regulator [Pseudomonas sp.]|jgi:two-component system response regulator RstA|nr:response regulator [Pseudomonas sp.]MDD2223202.1 response regulator [Pseudomonas sp.]MDY0415101.1 response regulator [Pseudomonas sp.]NLO55356.1 response regulator [Gammaproteobacteria bacterium]